MECFIFKFKTNIRAKYKNVFYSINRPNPLRERQAAIEVGRNCWFWRADCFRSEVSAWKGRCDQFFLLKAQHYPKILSKGKKDSWLQGNRVTEARAHNVP